MLKDNVAFVFPGQGSQAVGMLADFADEAIVQQTFEEASDTLGYDLWTLTSQGPAESLNQTDKTQPILLTASIALWRLWAQNSQWLPAYVAGHSLGEYSALVAAKAIAFKDGIRLVEQRGQFMQQAVPAGTGKMAAIIGLDDEKIQASCDEAAKGEVVSPVNFNSPGQVVIAGNVNAVERAMALCKEKGAKRALPLPVSVPSHCRLMEPAAAKLAEVLEGINIQAPEIQLVNNVDVAIESEPSKIKDALIRQLYCPVQWTGSVNFLVAKNVSTLVECGPGNVLSGLIKRIDKGVTTFQASKKESINQLHESNS